MGWYEVIGRGCAGIAQSRGSTYPLETAYPYLEPVTGPAPAELGKAHPCALLLYMHTGLMPPSSDRPEGYVVVVYPACFVLYEENSIKQPRVCQPQGKSVVAWLQLVRSVVRVEAASLRGLRPTLVGTRNTPERDDESRP